MWLRAAILALVTGVATIMASPLTRLQDHPDWARLAPNYLYMDYMGSLVIIPSDRREFTARGDDKALSMLIHETGYTQYVAYGSNFGKEHDKQLKLPLSDLPNALVGREPYSCSKWSDNLARAASGGSEYSNITETTGMSGQQPQSRIATAIISAYLFEDNGDCTGNQDYHPGEQTGTCYTYARAYSSVAITGRRDRVRACAWPHHNCENGDQLCRDEAYVAAGVCLNRKTFSYAAGIL